MQSHQSFYVIKEDGPLGYLPFLLMRTGTLGNVVSLIHTLGNSLDKDGIRGFNALFGKLGVEREGESSKICIGDFLIYDCKEKTFVHKNSSGRFFLDTAIDILKEGYEGLFNISDKNEYTEAIGRDIIPFSWYKVSNLYWSSKAMDLIDRLINSRYFLLHIYLYTTQAKSRSEFRALYNDIFSRMAEEENGSNTILNRCFMIKKTNEEEYGTQSQFEPLLISSEQAMRFPSLGAFDGYWVKADKSTSSYHWEEGFIYMLTHCLCKGFDLEIKDFINDGDEDFQTLLEHVINIGYVSEFNSSFRKKCTRLLEEKINRNSCFSVKHKENLEVQSGFINILGILGNFFVRFLNELGLEGKSVSDLKKEYEELQRISDLPVREEGDIVGRFTGLATKMIRSMEKRY